MTETVTPAWIEWAGGADPVADGELVEVEYRDGRTQRFRHFSEGTWAHDPGDAALDIVRYRKLPE